jgi:hypothetical protein
MLITTDDVFAAAFLHYCGYELISCSTALRSATYKFEVPECDAEICTQQMKDPETAILFTGFVSAMKSVQHAAKLSRQGMGHWSNYTGTGQSAIMPSGKQGSERT